MCMEGQVTPLRSNETATNEKCQQEQQQQQAATPLPVEPLETEVPCGWAERCCWLAQVWVMDVHLAFTALTAPAASSCVALSLTSATETSVVQGVNSTVEARPWQLFCLIEFMCFALTTSGTLMAGHIDSSDCQS